MINTFYGDNLFVKGLSLREEFNNFDLMIESCEIELLNESNDNEKYNKISMVQKVIAAFKKFLVSLVNKISKFLINISAKINYNKYINNINNKLHSTQRKSIKLDFPDGEYTEGYFEELSFMFKEINNAFKSIKFGETYKGVEIIDTKIDIDKTETTETEITEILPDDVKDQIRNAHDNFYDWIEKNKDKKYIVLTLHPDDNHSIDSRLKDLYNKTTQFTKKYINEAVKMLTRIEKNIIDLEALTKTINNRIKKGESSSLINEALNACLYLTKKSKEICFPVIRFIKYISNSDFPMISIPDDKVEEEEEEFFLDDLEEDED